MQSLEYLKTIFRYDQNSPTFLSLIKTGKTAGFKEKNNFKHGGPSYSWWVRVGKQRYALTKVIYYLYHGVECPEKMFIYPLDGDLDNLNPDSFALYPKAKKHVLSNRLNGSAYKEFKTVILSRDNPDYYKHPSEWSHPEAIAALEQEQAARASGQSVSPCKLGKNYRKRKQISGVS